MTNLSFKYTIGDDLEEGKYEMSMSHFGRHQTVIPGESKGYIEDIGSVQALLGSVRKLKILDMLSALFLVFLCNRPSFSPKISPF